LKFSTGSRQFDFKRFIDIFAIKFLKNCRSTD